MAGEMATLDRRQKGRTVLDLETYVPAILTFIGNRWSKSASRIYLGKFGVGINEWRIVSLLALEPGATANRICAVIGMDKSAASRSIQVLEDGGYLRLVADPLDRRRRLLKLTPQGLALHDQIIAIALDRERRMLDGLAADEIKTLLGLLHRLHGNVARMTERDQSDD